MNSMYQLHDTIADVRAEQPNSSLSEDNAFVAWFADAYLLGDRKEALEGLVGGSGDMGVDAVYIDHKYQWVGLVQGKYHRRRANDNSAVLSFGDLACRFAGADSRDEWDGPNQQAARKLIDAHDSVHRRGYKLSLYFATTGSVSQHIAEEARKQATQSGCERFDVIDRQRITRLHDDWLVGAAPPLRELTVRVLDLQPLHYGPTAAAPEAMVFSTGADQLRRLLEEAGERLFARNIRGYLGADNAINRDIGRTAAEKPERFWYVNNGVTLIADSISYTTDGAERLLRMANPQVVNGQQTIRTLAKAKGPLTDVRVLLKVIVSPPDESASAGIRGFAGMIVKGTNRQNSITPADLMANDVEQVRLERELRRRCYHYARRRMAATELTGSSQKGFIRIKREELANAVAVTTPGFFHFVGQQELWEPGHYEKLFRKDRDINDYLGRWHFVDWIRYFSRGGTDDTRKGAYYAVAATLWREYGVAEAFKSSAFRSAFVSASESSLRSVLDPLEEAARLALIVAGKLYRVEAKRNRPRGSSQQRRAAQRMPTAAVWFRRAGAPDALGKALNEDIARNDKVSALMAEFVARVRDQ